MRYQFVAGWLLTLSSSMSLAQVPAADLYAPPAGARHFIIESIGGKHGDSWSWVAADGARVGRESMNLRGQVWETDYRGTPGTEGTPTVMIIRGVTPQGDAAESFSLVGGSAQWRSPVDAGSA
ncbi:MAG: amidohydrolase family protein, partial [Steroidobacteraceae bacterium]